MKNEFRWWMIPLAFGLLVAILWLLISIDGGNLLPHEYDVH